MPVARYKISETFPIQFAWRLPNDDYLRAVFQAVVLDHVPQADKYIVRLTELIAGRQEDSDGNLRPHEDYAREYWRLAADLVGRKITIAYEADDGHALYMRLATLTGEHNFFTRYESAEVIARGLQAATERRVREEKKPPEDDNLSEGLPD
jgi:hypothetical protein